MGENDIVIARASKEIKNISDVECNIMIDELYNAFITEKAKKKTNVIKGFVEIGSSKSKCFGTVLSKLKLIPANSITSPMIVHIKGLKDINQSEIETLITTWKNENSKLK